MIHYFMVPRYSPLSRPSLDRSLPPATVTDAFNQMKSNYPNIFAVIWFNENKESDWRIDSFSASLTTYKTALAGLVSTPPTDGVAAKVAPPVADLSADSTRQTDRYRAKRHRYASRRAR